LIARDAEEQNDIASVEVKDSTGNISSKDTAGNITDLLVGLVLWVIPNIGRVILAGAEAIAIATTLVSGAINVTAGDLHSVLLALGIPKEQAQGYSDLVCKGYYIVIVTGIDIEILLAK
ncbi:MAG: hypothetical protein ACYT04_82530, partial [Nostoc sp.]